MALQSKTITGKTSSSVWTWKIVVIEESADVITKKSQVTIENYLGRPSSAGGSYFQGSSKLKFEADDQEYSKNYSSGSVVNVGAGKWKKLGSYTFDVDNNGTVGKPTTIDVSGSMSGANFSPSSASANGTLDLTPLHVSPQVTLDSVTETNSILSGVSGTTIVTNLSKKTFNLSYTLFDTATMQSIKILDKNGNELVSSNPVINATNGSILLDLTSQALASNNIANNKTSFIIRLTDSEGGITDLITPEYDVIPYNLPNLIQTSSSVKRNGQTSGKVVMNLLGTFYNATIGNTTNGVALSFKYWKINEAEPASYNSIPTDAYSITNNNISMNNWNVMVNNELIEDVIKSSPYKFKIKLVDFFANVSEVELICSKGEWIMAKYKDRVDFKKITINKVDVMDMLFFKRGDKITFPTLYLGGLVTSSNKRVYFTISLPKQISQEITNIIITNGKALIRVPTGGYINGGDATTDFIEYNSNGYTWDVSFFGGNTITIRIIKTTDFVNSTNNTPVAIELSELQLQFNS